MGLADRQALLAMLFTDASLRERFAANPLGTALALGVSPDNAAHMAQLRIPQVRQFAESLGTKRLHEVEKLLPLSCLALGNVLFHNLFKQHARRFLPIGPTKHRDDAIAFAAFARQTLRDPTVGTDWSTDVLCYEAAWLLANDASRRFTVRRLHHSIADLARRMRAGETGLVPASRWSLAVWFRPSRHGTLRHFVFSLPR